MLVGIALIAKYQSCRVSSVLEPDGDKPLAPGEMAAGKEDRLTITPEPPGVSQVVDPEPAGLVVFHG